MIKTAEEPFTKSTGHFKKSHWTLLNQLAETRFCGGDGVANLGETGKTQTVLTIWYKKE